MGCVTALQHIICLQVLVDHLMTAADMKADVVVTSALQCALAMLPSADTQEGEVTFELLQHLIPSQKHLTLLQRHFEVGHCTAIIDSICCHVCCRHECCRAS